MIAWLSWLAAGALVGVTCATYGFPALAGALAGISAVALGYTGAALDTRRRGRR